MAASPNMTEYERTFASFRLEAPERFNFCRDVFDRWAEKPDRVALWWVDDEGHEARWTFA